MLTRRLPAAAMAAVLLASLWCLVLAGPVLATTASVPNPPSAVHTSAPAFASDARILQSSVEQGKLETTAQHKTTRAATPKEAPDGSPLYLQLIMIAILLVLGASYFKLMSHSGRRAPAAKPAAVQEVSAEREKLPADA